MKQSQLKVEGGKELAKLLRTLPDKVADKLLANATMAGGRRLTKAIKNKTPVDTGRLRDSIKVKKDRVASRYTFTVNVGPAGKGRFYAHLVEFGSAPHVIKSKRKRVLSNGQEVFGKIVKHPGTSAQPFMRPALDESANDIIKHISKNLWRGIEREAKKLASRYKTR